MTDIFRRLTQLARQHPELPPACYRVRAIDYVLSLDTDPDGAPTMAIEPYGEPDAVPMMRRSGFKPMPMLAVDNAAYVLGQDGDGVTEKQAAERFQAFWGRIGEWVTGSYSHAAATAALWAVQHSRTLSGPEMVPAKSRVAVRVKGVLLHRLPEAVAQWQAVVEQIKGGPQGLCVACGETRVLAASLPNAIPAHLLPRAEYDAQLSVLPEGERAKGHLPVCVRCGDLAASALESLLGDERHAFRFPGQRSATVMFSVRAGGEEYANR